MSRKRSTKTTPPKPDLVSLLAELDHPDSNRRRDAVEALGHLDEPQATSALLHALEDLGDIQVLPALQRTQAHDHAMTVLGSVSEAATEAIDHLQWQNRGSE